MPIAKIRGVSINYEILGTRGPWVALSPGGRRAIDSVKAIATRLADAGYRVLVHDRRNCGASEVVIEDGSQSEYEIWADDLYELLGQLDARPAIVGGSSSGCRLSILFALRHPEAVRALLLWRVTGGAFAARRLAENYYGQFIREAEQGGMAAVCETEHFRDRIAARPANRDRLMAMDPAKFIDVMSRWRVYFDQGADVPVIGASAQDLGSIRVPTIVVPGNDRTHGIETGRTAQRMIPGSELFELASEDVDVDLVPPEEWARFDGTLAGAFIDFLDRALVTEKA